jgi:hypothetical protein
MKKITEIMDSLSFQGVSGRIEFNRQGSRYTNVNVLQWQDNDFVSVCTYVPKIIDRSSHDGSFECQKEPQWSKENGKPDDGRESCTVGFFADSMGLECHTANTIIILILCFIFILACSGFSFFFWKHKYAKKLEESAQIAMTYGRVVNGVELSKWEIPRENVIINRRIGEGTH